MLRTAISRAGTSRLSSMVMPLVVALLSALPGCDKEPGQAERRYCDQSGCYACVAENCYPVPGDATKPVDTPPGTVSSCDNDAVCGTGSVCDIGKCGLQEWQFVCLRPLPSIGRCNLRLERRALRGRLPVRCGQYLRQPRLLDLVCQRWQVRARSGLPVERLCRRSEAGERSVCLRRGLWQQWLPLHQRLLPDHLHREQAVPRRLGLPQGRLPRQSASAVSQWQPPVLAVRALPLLLTSSTFRTIVT